ncbi:M15 family metallopeptidase [Blautia sp. Marseille-P3201T]|uniref:M15 family metallopeptidase n=1 Tax=Blautia sp. Marseille-P3201T TaxID=1907659 RepID=UPI000930A7A7|nr:M15 family metallopeptidase [Blautia sp. Marseille-P3201T]
MRMRRRRYKGDIRRIRQRNGRIFLVICLVVFGAAAVWISIDEEKSEEKAKQAYKEQISKEEQEDEQEPQVNVEPTGPVLADETEKQQWYLRLVNKDHPMTEADVPEVAIETVDANGYQVDVRIMQDLEAMFADARAAGRNPMICSAFREWDMQVSLYENKIERVMQEEGLTQEEAAIKASTVVAKPGTSEHQVGLALDIVSSDYQELDEAQMETEDQKWLMENSWKYGFILRYPMDKSDITGIIFEPWHYRYVGKKAAKEITEQNITLEEYVGAGPVQTPVF